MFHRISLPLGLAWATLALSSLLCPGALAQCTAVCPLGLSDALPRKGSCDFTIEASWSPQGIINRITAAPGDTITAYYFLRDDEGAPSTQHLCGFEAGLVGTKSLTLVDVLAGQGLAFLAQDLPLQLTGPQDLYAEFEVCGEEPPHDYLFALVVAISETATVESDWLIFWPEEIWPEQFLVAISCECSPYVVCASGLPVLPPGFLEVEVKRVPMQTTTWGATKARF